MAKKEVFFLTPAKKQAFFTTSGSFPTFLTSPQSKAFFTTFEASPTFISSSRSTSFLNTFLSSPTFVTSSKSVAFLTTVFTGTPRDLKLRIGTLEVATDGTFVVVPDATGEYNPAEPNENPGGYNPESEPTEQYRPKRSQVWLWTVYRIRSRSDADGYGKNTQTPSSQAEQGDVPYEYTLTLPTEINEESGEALPITGLYELILIAAPRFTAVDTNGVYADDTSGTYEIINGTDTAFADTLVDGDFLYYIDSTNGDLYYVEQIDKVFDNTSLNLIDTPGNIPSVGTKLYGSNTVVSPLPSNSGGTSVGLTSGQYYIVYGDTTLFETYFSNGQYLYAISGSTGDYVELGQILDITSDVELNLYNKTEASPENGETLVASNTPFTAIKSNGTFDSDQGTTIFGDGTEFTNFSSGQYLYYRDFAEDLVLVGTIQDVISNTEIELTGLPVNVPVVGTILYASNDTISPLSISSGSLSSIGSVQTYYTLTGTGTSFTAFSSGDYIILSDGQEYNQLGQIGFVQSDTSIVLYSVSTTNVTAGLFILSSPNPVSLIDTEGTFLSYETGTYYNVEGDGTTFLTTAEPEQYLFYYGNSQYNLMGQIFKVYDETNVWLYEAPVGSPTPNVSPLYTSSSPYTENANYANYIGNTNLYDIAAQYPGWYVTSVGIMLDDAVANCITDMRYRYLQAVMCGKCDDTYPELYAYYVGMLESMAVNEWERATEFYEKIKGMCTSEECSCSTC